MDGVFWGGGESSSTFVDPSHLSVVYIFSTDFRFSFLYSIRIYVTYTL